MGAPSAGRRPSTRLPVAVAAVLAAAFMVSTHLKVRHTTGLARFDYQDEMGFFKVESAFQYRYARMIAQGEALPEIDRAAQYPEGVRVSRELTTWMEYATGWTYQAWPFKSRPSFNTFVVFWVSVFSSLSILAFYLAAVSLSHDPPWALAATLAYGLSWASISDLIGTYGFQCFALPFIFLCAASFMTSLDPEERRPGLWAAVSGVSLFVALASWHVTRFYLAALLAAAAWALLRSRDDPDSRKRLGRGLATLIAFAAAAGVILPHLRESRFLISPTMGLGYGVLAGAFLRPRALPALLAAEMILFIGLGQAGTETSSYGHVYGLIAEKLSHALVKPENPLALSRAARILWVGPFGSPEAGLLIYAFFPLALITALRLLPGKDAEKSSAAGALADGLACLTLIGTIMIARLAPALAFFLCLASARKPLAGSLRSFAFGALICLAGLEGFKTFSPASPFNPFMRLSAAFTDLNDAPTFSLQNERTIFHWLRGHARGKPVLAHFGLSGAILAYTESPVLLNPKLESASIRSKIEEYLEALYSDEAAMLAFCDKYGAKLFVYSTDYVLNRTRDGALYASGNTGFKKEQAAILFQFFPEKLQSFRLVHENEDFRIFEAGVAGARRAAKTVRNDRTDPIYDISRFTPRYGPEGSLEIDVASVLERRSTHREQVFLARILTQMNQREAALRAYEKAFSAWPPEEGVQAEAAQLAGQGRFLPPR